jgi:hypothetical protein
MLCSECKSGYQAPYERFERLATRADGPTYLMRCKPCGALWHEMPRGATRLSKADARALYPAAHL